MYENQSIYNYILFLFISEVNKQLRDENDSLRAVIESNKITNTPVEVTKNHSL